MFKGLLITAVCVLAACAECPVALLHCWCVRMLPWGGDGLIRRCWAACKNVPNVLRFR